MQRRKIIAGNWKMNTTTESATALANAVSAKTTAQTGVKIIISPPFPYLALACEATKQRDDISVAAQNCNDHASGAFTGEVSTAMLKDLGVEYVIIGHSERREYFGEKPDFLAKKIDAVLAAGLTPIFCCGEPLATRKANRQVAYVQTQLRKSLFHLSSDLLKQIVIAYEPIWAIGTGETASAEQAQAMHAAIRSYICNKYSADLAQQIPLLYGGSCNAQNAKTLFSQTDIDGGLIGGASLKADDFKAIIEAI